MTRDHVLNDLRLVAELAEKSGSAVHRNAAHRLRLEIERLRGVADEAARDREDLVTIGAMLGAGVRSTERILSAIARLRHDNRALAEVIYKRQEDVS